MTDIPAARHGKQAVFQIQNRVNILIRQNPLFVRQIWQPRPSVFFQNPVIDLVQIPGYIHTAELFPNTLHLFFGQVAAVQRLILVYKILQNRIHT